MSETKEQAVRAAFQGYLRGEQPQEVELVRAPKLDVWEAAVRTKDGAKTLVLKGEVAGHPSYRDGERVTTSPVIWLDRQCRWARTIGRLYKLEGRVIDEDIEL